MVSHTDTDPHGHGSGIQGQDQRDNKLKTAMERASMEPNGNTDNTVLPRAQLVTSRRPPVTDIDKILEARNSHGKYEEIASISQSLKATMHSVPGWNKLTPAQQEALDLHATKVGRILSGNGSDTEHWGDIAGYAKLVIIDIEGVKK